MQGPRVAIVGVWLESNRQAPVAMQHDFSSYYCLEGAAILDAARAESLVTSRVSLLASRI